MIRPTTVVSLANLMVGVGVMLGHTVVAEQGVQERTKHTSLRGTSVENQHGRCVVAYPYHLGAVQDPVAERGV